jgi:hypothetical protein
MLYSYSGNLLDNIEADVDGEAFGYFDSVRIHNYDCSTPTDNIHSQI